MTLRRPPTSVKDIRDTPALFKRRARKQGRVMEKYMEENYEFLPSNTLFRQRNKRKVTDKNNKIAVFLSNNTISENYKSNTKVNNQ